MYWDFELDLLLSEVIHMFKNVKSAKLDRVLCHDGEPPLLGYGILLAYNVDDCKSGCNRTIITTYMLIYLDLCLYTDINISLLIEWVTYCMLGYIRLD